MTTSDARQDTGPDPAGAPVVRSVLPPLACFPLSEMPEHPACAVLQAAEQRSADDRRDGLAPGRARFLPACAMPAHCRSTLVLLDRFGRWSEYAARSAQSSPDD